jgi:hypothetical protein
MLLKTLFLKLQNNEYNVKIRTGLQHLKTWMIIWTSIGLGKVLGNIKILARESLHHYELKQHKSWFDEECSKLSHKRKQTKLQSCRIQAK